MPSGTSGPYVFGGFGKLTPKSGSFAVPLGYGVDRLHGVYFIATLPGAATFLVLTYLRPRHPTGRWTMAPLQGWTHLARLQTQTNQTVDIWGVRF